MAGRNTVLLVAAAAVAAFPMLFSLSDEAKFTGADDRAKSVIREISPDYRPWASALWEPPSNEVQSLLFSLQAALGAGLVGYYFGHRRARAEARREQGIERDPRTHAAR